MVGNILELSHITKIYDNGVQALRNIDLDVKKGEIHAIVGENGAGKSTLMKIIFGLEHPSGGNIQYKGKDVSIENVDHAIHMGIGMVHQHFMLVPSFTVAENVLLGMEEKKGLAVDTQKANNRVKEFAETYNFRLNPIEKAENLAIGMKQKVEIVKALIRGAEVLILDEPTAVLTPQETEELFEQLKLLKQKGHTILFISHKLNEVKEISDRLTVIRKGETMGTYDTGEVSVQEISRLMVGRNISLSYERNNSAAGESILKIQQLSVPPEEGNIALKQLTFAVEKGRILGIAGVEGNGQNELIKVLTGENNRYKGSVTYHGEEVKKMSLSKARAKGLSFIPEDRMHMGTAGAASIQDNIISNRMNAKDLVQGATLNLKKIKELTKNIIRDYQVAHRDETQPIQELSGGNIQKIVVGRECSIGPDLLIAEQPTRGIDLGAIESIHKKLISMRDNDTAILLVSADLAEVKEVSDALIVLYEGEIVAYIKNPSKVSDEILGEYMLGIRRQSAEEIGDAYHEKVV